MQFQFDLEDASCKKEMVCEAEFLEYGPDNYLKSATWSSDGRLILTTSKDSIVRIFQPDERVLLSGKRPEDEPDVMKSVLRFKTMDVLYDVCWYPASYLESPSTCCFLTTSKHQPVLLKDAFNGHTRATYCAQSPLEQPETCLSVRWSHDASLVFAGSPSGCLFVWDSSREGLPSLRIPLFSRRNEGLCSLAVLPSSSVVACGTFAGSVMISDLREGKKNGLLQTTDGGGVTHMQCVGEYELIVGSRKSQHVEVFDLRMSSSQCAFVSFHRPCPSQQPIVFHAHNNVLFSGDSSLPRGLLSAHSLRRPNATPPLHLPLHDDTIAAVHAHPFAPIILTATGHRPSNNMSDTQSHPQIAIWRLPHWQQH